MIQYKNDKDETITQLSYEESERVAKWHLDIRKARVNIWSPDGVVKYPEVTKSVAELETEMGEFFSCFEKNDKHIKLDNEFMRENLGGGKYSCFLIYHLFMCSYEVPSFVIIFLQLKYPNGMPN